MSDDYPALFCLPAPSGASGFSFFLFYIFFGSGVYVQVWYIGKLVSQGFLAQIILSPGY